MTRNAVPREKASILRGVMLTAAVKHQVTFTNWSQYTIGHNQLYDDWIRGGLCQGLSAKFLDCVRRGVDFLAEVNFDTLKIPGQYEKTPLQNEIFHAAVVGNIRGKNWDQLGAFMEESYQLHPVEVVHFKTGTFRGPISRFSRYVTQGEYYYMMEFPGHALAAVAHARGYFFFDPNCGIAYTNQKSAMRSFYSAFLGHSFTQGVYGHGHGFPINVQRLTG